MVPSIIPIKGGTKDRHKVLVPIEVLLAIKDIMVGSGMLELVGRSAWLVCTVERVSSWFGGCRLII